MLIAQLFGVSIPSIFVYPRTLRDFVLAHVNFTGLPSTRLLFVVLVFCGWIASAPSLFTDHRSRKQGPTSAAVDADREPTDMVTRKGQPGAEVPAVEGKKGKKAARSDAQDASRDPADMMSKFRPEPEVELLDDGVLPVLSILNQIC